TDSHGDLTRGSKSVNAIAESPQTPAPPTKAEKLNLRPDAVVSLLPANHLTAVDALSPQKQSPATKEALTQPKFIVSAPDNSMQRAPLKSISPYATQRRTASQPAF